MKNSQKCKRLHKFKLMLGPEGLHYRVHCMSKNECGCMKKDYAITVKNAGGQRNKQCKTLFKATFNKKDVFLNKNCYEI